MMKDYHILEGVIHKSEGNESTCGLLQCFGRLCPRWVKGCFAAAATGQAVAGKIPALVCMQHILQSLLGADKQNTRFHDTICM